jgi:hypothetical protein
MRSALLLLGLCSCTSPRFYDHRFQPAPNEAQFGTEAVAGSQVRSLVTVMGIERPQEDHGARAVVRMRLENLGAAAAKVDVGSMSLVSADLAEFEAAQVAFVEPAQSAGGEIAAGQHAVFDLVFPLPAGRKESQIDLSGLNLRFTVLFDGQAATASAHFQRMEWYRDSPCHVSIGVGYSSD